MTPSPSKTFCPLPWVHQATLTDGALLPCCVAKPFKGKNLNESTLQKEFHSKEWNQIRKDMLQGEKPSQCKRCWEEEDSGYRSHRLMEVDVWKRRLGEDGLNQLVASTQENGAIQAAPLSIDLRIGNTCNLACVMCRPHESTKWLSLSEDIYSKTYNLSLKMDMLYKKSLNMSRYNWQDEEKIWEELKLMAPHLQELIIGGGEPMLLRRHFDFVEFCVKNGYAKKMHLRYHTNLTNLNTSYFSLWKEFKVVEFFASIDGFGEKNFYNRYPAKWDEIEKNLRALDQLPHDNIQTMILFSSHFLSLYNLDELCRWLEQQNYRKVTKGFNGYLHPAIVMDPRYLNPQVYPQKIKDKITQKIHEFEKNSLKPSNKISGVLQFMNAADESGHLSTTLEYIRQLDRSRGTNFQTTFPELAADLEGL